MLLATVLFTLARLLIAEDISEVEQEWKVQFHEWSTKYIVDWKLQYDAFTKGKESECGGGKK